MKGAISMPRKSKIDLELKINLVKQVAHHQLSISEAVRKAHVDKTTFRQWLLAYSQEGIEGLYPTTHNRVYAPELNLKAVRDYLAGNGSQFSICEKYGIHSPCQLRDWIKVYTTHGEFSRSTFSGGGSTVSKSRKASQEEKYTIVTDCIENGDNYGAMAKKYNVSYQQVRNWTIAFKEQGKAGLEDRRGKRKKDQQPRSEAEKMQIEIERLKHQLYLAEMETKLLKKLNELEGKNAYRK